MGGESAVTTASILMPLMPSMNRLVMVRRLSRMASLMARMSTIKKLPNFLRTMCSRQIMSRINLNKSSSV